MTKKVLIAEDYDDTRYMLRFMLEGYGYQVLEAVNGLEAFEITLSEHPDLVLMDISMPIMDGLTATQLIRSKGNGCSQVPIIALTAHGESFYRKAVAAGCNDLINKPLDMFSLQPLIQNYLRRDTAA